jgi:hypothetical protein
MIPSLSAESETYIADALAAGLFSSREALLDAAIAEFRALRAEEEEQLRLCDEAIDSLEAGHGIPATPEYWADLERRILAAAESKRLQANQQ